MEETMEREESARFEMRSSCKARGELGSRYGGKGELKNGGGTARRSERGGKGFTLAMDAELSPSGHLGALLEGTEASRKTCKNVGSVIVFGKNSGPARGTNEGAGFSRHDRFPLVHRDGRRFLLPRGEYSVLVVCWKEL